MKKKYNWLSDSLYEKGINLKEIGVNNYGWRYPDIIDVLKIANNNEGIILGGDVYFIEGNRLNSKGDSWFYNKSGDDDIQTSYKHAYEYVDEFIKRNDNCVFTIIVV